jgi:hypothetical protein
MINIDSPDREIIQLSQNKNELRFFEVIREFASRMGWAPSVWIKWFLRMYFKTIDAYPVRIGVSKHSLTLNSDNGLFVAIRDEVRVVKSHGFFV